MCVNGSVGVCNWECGSVWLGVGECVDGSGGVCNWEWGSVCLGVGECVDGGGLLCAPKSCIFYFFSLFSLCMHIRTCLCPLSCAIGFSHVCAVSKLHVISMPTHTFT